MHLPTWVYITSHCCTYTVHTCSRQYESMKMMYIFYIMVKSGKPMQLFVSQPSHNANKCKPTMSDICNTGDVMSQ